MKQQVSFLIIFASTAKNNYFQRFSLFFLRNTAIGARYFLSFLVSQTKNLNILPSFVRNFSKNILSSPLDLFTLAPCRLFFHP